jgi:hypothetical protein
MYISLTIFLFRSGIAFYFHLLSTGQVTVRPKKKCVFTVTIQKNLGSVCNKKKKNSGKPSFDEAVFYDELRSFSTFFALNFDKKLAVE